MVQQLSVPPQGSGYSYTWYRDGGRINHERADSLVVKRAGSYFAQIKSGNCTYTTDALTVSELNLQAKITVTPPESDCEGAATLLNANTGQDFTYQWLRNNTPVENAISRSYAATEAGFYTVIVKYNGCQVQSAEVKVEAVTAPVVKITGEESFCPGESIILDVPLSEDYAFQWLKNGTELNGATDKSLVVSESGTYQLRYTDQFCSKYTAEKVVSEIEKPFAISEVEGEFEGVTGQKLNFTIKGNADAKEFYWELPAEGLIYSADVKKRNVQLIFSKAGTKTLQVYVKEGSCYSDPFEVSVTIEHDQYGIPEAVKLKKDLSLPLKVIERHHMLEDLNAGFEEDVFRAPPCQEGKYYVGFQLHYDLGDKKTDVDWSADLLVSLLHRDDTVWTKPLHVETTDQIFITTVFHHSPISCPEDYRFFINAKHLTGEVPEDNIYFRIHLFKVHEEVFDPNAHVELNCNYSGNQAQISWNSSGESVRAYDVEWVFIADHEGFTGTTAEQAFGFKEPVRVTVEGTSYEHLVYYPDGSLWYRVRAIGYNPEHPGHRINGKWFYTPCGTIRNHNPNITWQQQTAFAEEGKYKKVMHYYDGSQRERQVQTNLSSEEITLVGEIFYDFEGRPSVNVLPVPAGTTSLNYKQSFNIFEASQAIVSANTSDTRYKFHYDNMRIENSILSSSKGAGLYYSPANSFNGIHRDYIPDSEGYAYSQTEYLNDGTGRISKQSGVGKEFRADGTHTTKYFYGSATEEELVRLFGSNVGNAKHYKKNMVVDPNGQVSISYLDQEGKVIATSLAGDPPGSLMHLESYDQNGNPITVSLKSKNKAEDGNKVISHNFLNVSPSTSYTFTYDLSALASQIRDFGCQICSYDLKIFITDSEGKAVELPVIEGNQSENRHSFVLKNLTAQSCETLTQKQIEFSVFISEIGDYTINKVLKPNDISYEAISSIIMEEEFVKEHIKEIEESYKIDEGNCEICTSCEEAEEIINETIMESVALDCENLYQQIVADIQSKHADGFAYTPGEAEIEGHVLYCEYELCKKDERSDVFDKQLSRVANWSSAVGGGYSNALHLDPFFNNQELSGYPYKTQMQSKLNDVFLAEVPGIKEYRGTILQVTDPANTNFYIDENGNHDPSGGKHILYKDLMSRRSQLGEERYHAELNKQRWIYYKSFYSEAKRKTKLEIPAYRNCPSAKVRLELNDQLPQEEEEINKWGEENFVITPVSDEELEMQVVNLAFVCEAKMSDNDSIAITQHLKSYFDANPGNFFRHIIREDLGVNEDLNAIESILSKYDCSLDSVAVYNPVVCLRDTTYYVSGNKHELRRVNNFISEESTFDYQKEEKEFEIASSSNESVVGHFLIGEELEEWEKYEMEMFAAMEEEGRQKYDFESNLNEIGLLSMSTSDIPYPLDLEEFNALRDFYYATGGEGWAYDWGQDIINYENGRKKLEDIDISKWRGIYSVDSSGYSMFFHSSFGLRGYLPESIGNLKGVQRLIIHGRPAVSSTFISGDLPKGIGKLINLVDLQLNGLDISGQIPDEIGDLRNLRTLWLADRFSGNIPPSIGNLTNLQELGLSGQFTTSNLEFLGNLHNLQRLRLSPGNMFKGNIPSSITNLSNLEDLYISGRGLTGKLPSVENLSNLTSLTISVIISDIDPVRLDERPFSSFSKLKKLTRLVLRGTSLTGSLPSDIGELINLEHLDLDGNKITEIPVSIGELPNLRVLSLSNNLLTSFPTSISELEKLRSLYLRYNKFTFKDLLTIRNGYSSNLYYQPQQLIDEEKTLYFIPGEPVTLTTEIDRDTSPPCQYQWFKVENGSTVAINTASENGHTVTFFPTKNDFNNQYFYRITNTKLPLLTLTSQMQKLEPESEPAEPIEVTVCLEYDYNNPTLQKLTFNVDFEKLVEECMARAEEEKKFLVEKTIEKWVERRAVEFYRSFQTQCINNVNENLKYSYSSKEYHYTLYYYDQSQNLVQTVPPEGVKPLTSQQVTNFINGNKTEPDHKLVTRYKYNSINQLIWQKTPDAGESEFWYNDVAQLRLSQNAQQKLDNHYSYSKYDKQGRITEVGEMEAAYLPSDLSSLLNDLSFPGSASYTVSDITRTHYDFANGKVKQIMQENLRSRVSWVEVIDKNATDTIATYYSYDIHGNIKTLLQHIPDLGHKRTDYRYDLVSGNVNYVFYQYGEPDQFVHKYRYDSDNRLTHVYTSTDRFIWNKEASYRYYKHGPLARMELGEYRVQGLDYYYTLQGWLKGVNMPYEGDPGKDGTGNSKVGKDVFAFALGYHQDDYKPIGSLALNINQRDQLWTRLDEQHHYKGLYNGNIAWMTTDLGPIGANQGDRAKGMQSMLYKYDQLNRIKIAQSLTHYQADQGFNSRTSEPQAYDARYSYDANGNLLTLQRWNEQGDLQDEFEYNYYAGTNRLKNVGKGRVDGNGDKEYGAGQVEGDGIIYRRIILRNGAYVPSGAKVELLATESIDIDPEFEVHEGAEFEATIVEPDSEGAQNFFVYEYDAIGNLIADHNEGVKISWTPYGKVREVVKSDSVKIKFRYDGTGNRVEKIVEKADTSVHTVYVRDASGNVLSIYTERILKEQAIYGSSRIGHYKGGELSGQRSLGRKYYELSNHLGNVLAVITDNAGMNADSVWATVVSTADYYPFGLQMKGRTFSAEEYRYGFNGKEKVDEISGSGNWYSFEFREYDPRTGRFNSIDPLTKQYPWQSPYVFAANNPIMFVDIMGLGPGDPPTSTKEDANNRIGELSKNLQQSEHFKNVSPEEFINQITERINNPSGINQGDGTNFCWAAACMSYVYEKNPAGMVDAMFSLYTTGTFNYANGGDGFSFSPADYINDASGSSTFNNYPGLAGNKVDQMLFMTLGAAFKGYMNRANPTYQPGDEATSWAGGNLGKAKDLWNAFGYDVKVSGSDLGWGASNKGGTVMTTLTSHDVVLYINSPLFLRDNWGANWTGTHYIRVDQMSSSNGNYKVNYWDYGGWKRGKDARTISHNQFWWSTYGMIAIPR